MVRTPMLAAALICAATPALAAGPSDVTAIYNTRTQNFCIAQTGRDDADQAEPSIRRRPCRNAGQWRAHGIRFKEPVIIAAALPPR